MNYETATNNQLEDRLAKLIGFKPTEFDELACAVVRSLKAEGCVDLDEKETPSPDYCTDWGATMPLAIEHGITLLFCSGSYEVSYDYEAPTGSYGCGEILSSHIDVEKSGVLRAIVICLINKLES